MAGRFLIERIKLPPNDAADIHEKTKRRPGGNKVKRIFLCLALTTSCAAITTPLFASAGLERRNIDTAFLFNPGTYAEFSQAVIAPDFPGVAGNPAFSLESGMKAAPSFNITTAAVKSQITDNLSVGVWYTSNGNGVNLDYGVITFVPTGFQSTVFAEVEAPTLAAMAKFNLSEGVSVIAGVKQVSLGKSTLTLGSDSPFIAGAGIDATYTWETGTKSEVGAIYGLAYEVPEIALRAIVTFEEEIDITVDTTATSGAPVATTGDGSVSIGDAINFSFQTGISENTLLSAGMRFSRWLDNQVYVPTIGGPFQVSDFGDDRSYSLGLGRKLSDQWSVSASLFNDPADGRNVSELEPGGDNTSLSLGARYSPSEALNVSFGGTYSRRGDSNTENFGVVFEESSVMTYGVKVGFNF